ncbi:hypothetical protein PENTCL1PPCAC_19615, partial [Pristionchus entomophagus]
MSRDSVYENFTLHIAHTRVRYNRFIIPPTLSPVWPVRKQCTGDYCFIYRYTLTDLSSFDRGCYLVDDALVNTSLVIPHSGVNSYWFGTTIYCKIDNCNNN